MPLFSLKLSTLRREVTVIPMEAREERAAEDHPREEREAAAATVIPMEAREERAAVDHPREARATAA